MIKNTQNEPWFYWHSHLWKTRDCPRTVFGKQGQFQRHEVVNENTYNFRISHLLRTVFEDSEIELVNLFSTPDTINGRDMAPALNVFAEKIVVKVTYPVSKTLER